MNKIEKGLFLPVHVIPFPLKPELQVHVKLPGILVHAALESQLSINEEHSLISRCRKDNLGLKT